MLSWEGISWLNNEQGNRNIRSTIQHRVSCAWKSMGLCVPYSMNLHIHFWSKCTDFPFPRQDSQHNWNTTPSEIPVSLDETESDPIGTIILIYLMHAGQTYACGKEFWFSHVGPHMFPFFLMGTSPVCILSPKSILFQMYLTKTGADWGLCFLWFTSIPNSLRFKVTLSQTSLTAAVQVVWTSTPMSLS